MLNKRANGSILHRLPTETKNPKTQTQLLTARGIFLRMRVRKMGERMEIKHQKLLAGVICHCRRLGDPGQHP